MKSSIRPLGNEYTLILNDAEAEWLQEALDDPVHYGDNEKGEAIRNSFLDAFKKRSNK